MGKNKGKGGKSFRSGKKDRTDTRRALVYKETYAEEEGADGAPQVCKWLVMEVVSLEPVF